jgi:membrane fusion protein, multidrug efflux system
MVMHFLRTVGRVIGAVFRWIGLRRILLVLVLFICGVLLAFNFILRPMMIASFFAGQKPPAVAVSATEVKPTTWTPTIDAIGTLWALQGVDVASEAAGVVKSINFSANQRIDAGALLVQIDDAVERADLMSAEAAVARDRSQLERTKQLRATGVNSQATLQDSESALAASMSALAKVKAVVDQKSIEAPFSGVIGIPRIDVGQYIQPGTVIATLQQLDTMKVDFTVPEQQVEEIKMGQTAKFGLTDADFAHEGTITGIDPKIDPQTRLVSVRAEVENPDGALRPGQFVRVRVELPPVENVIALPQTAVVTSLYGDYVYVVEDETAAAAPTAKPDDAANAGGNSADLRTSIPSDASTATDAAKPPATGNLVAKQVFVQLGLRQGDLVEIASGLKPGQTVVTSGQNKLANNSPVKIDNSVDPAAIALDGGGNGS